MEISNVKRTIELTPKWTKWSYLFNGIVNTAIGINILAQANSWMHWSSVLAYVLVFAGPILVIYGIILFNPVGNFAPKVQVSEKGVGIKADVFKKQISVEWASVKEITYKAYELDFLLTNNHVEMIKLPTSAEKSVEVKRAIREYADGAGINIIGG